MLISYPTTGRKTLQEGTTKINIKSKQIIFPDGTEDTFYSAKELVEAKSYLIYVNEQVDVTFYLKGAVVYKGTQFPTLDRANLTFDLIEIIASTSTVQLVLKLSDEVNGVSSLVIRLEKSVDASNYESITVADTAIGLTSDTYGSATKAEMTLETAQIRVRKDGTDPTAAEGHPVEIGDIITLNSAADIATFKAIRTGGTSGVLKVTYSR